MTLDLPVVLDRQLDRPLIGCAQEGGLAGDGVEGADLDGLVGTDGDGPQRVFAAAAGGVGHRFRGVGRRLRGVRSVGRRRGVIRRRRGVGWFVSPAGHQHQGQHREQRQEPNQSLAHLFPSSVVRRARDERVGVQYTDFRPSPWSR